VAVRKRKEKRGEGRERDAFIRGGEGGQERKIRFICRQREGKTKNTPGESGESEEEKKVHERDKSDPWGGEGSSRILLGEKKGKNRKGGGGPNRGAKGKKRKEGTIAHHNQVQGTAAEKGGEKKELSS